MSLQHEPVEFRGTPCIRLRSADATALVALRGGQLLSWIPADGRERLFLAERAEFAPAAAIRGGVPVIFPQFGDRGALRKHGFARVVDWSFAGIEHAAAHFELRDCPATADHITFLTDDRALSWASRPRKPIGRH